MAKTHADVETLAAQLLALPTSDKFTMAAMLVASGKLDIAERVAEAAVEDLQARRLLGVTRAPLTRKAGR